MLRKFRNFQKMEQKHCEQWNKTKIKEPTILMFSTIHVRYVKNNQDIKITKLFPMS